jgi:hypothetical protein
MNHSDTILLHDNNTTATLTLPAAYESKAFASDGAQFDCQYPSMLPVTNKMEVSDITINILLGRSGKSPAEQTFAQAQSDNFDPRRPGAAYRAGTLNEYQIFISKGVGNLSNEPNAITTYYIFKAKDGQWVQVSWDGWSAIYTFERQISKSIAIKYLLVKSKGMDFIHIDDVVTTFIKKHLKTEIH